MGQAQDTLELKEIKAISCFSVDAKGNMFIADNAFTLFKYDVTGKLITNVNIKSYGELTSIDCTNPFEIYAFYQDQNIIVFYDNMLNVRGELRLNNYFFNNVSCVSRSFDNNIWLLDLSQYKLLKINKKGETIAESAFLNNVLGEELNTYKIWEENNNVYVADSVIGVFMFDIYATYSSTFPIKGTQSVTSNKAALFFNQNGKLIRYGKLFREPVITKLNVPRSTTFDSKLKKLFYFDGNKIISYPTEY
jgi:hypothetical protein